MPRPCSICQHPAREAMDQALAAQAPYRTIAERFDTSPAALHRHKGHTGVPASPAAPPGQVPALVDAAQQLAMSAQALHRQADASSTVPAMLLTLREGTRVLVEVTALLVQLTSSAPPPAAR